MARCQKVIYESYGKEKHGAQCSNAATCLVLPSQYDNWTYRCDEHAYEYRGAQVVPLREEETDGNQ